MRCLTLMACSIVAIGLTGCTDERVGILPPTAAREGDTTQRPIEEFVSAQGTFCLPDGGGGCVLFVPPLDNFLGWFDPATGDVASVDYAGIANAWIMDESGGALSLGTSHDGQILERPLPDGRAELKVILHTSNALTWAASDFDFLTPLIFGARAPDVLSGANAALGASTLELTFVNTAVGLPIPDLMQLLFAPEPGQEVSNVVFRSSAAGELREGFGTPDGTPGRMVVLQRGLFDIPGQGNGVGDGFPVEFIKLRPIGHVPM